VHVGQVHGLLGEHGTIRAPFDDVLDSWLATQLPRVSASYGRMIAGDLPDEIRAHVVVGGSSGHVSETAVSESSLAGCIWQDRFDVGIRQYGECFGGWMIRSSNGGKHVRSLPRQWQRPSSPIISSLRDNDVFDSLRIDICTL